MSKQSKKIKKPKFKKASVLLASEIKNYVHTKFDTDNDEFWGWFFKNCPLGETKLFNFENDNVDITHDTLPSSCRQYYIILKNEFMPDADEGGCIEIENDL